MAFPRGLTGAHRIANASSAPTRLLIISTMNFPDVAEHLDTGTWLAITDPQSGKAFEADTDVPFMDIVVRAMYAAVERDT